MEPLKVAVAGLGTVGARVVRLVHEEKDLLEKRCGRPIIVTAVSARDRHRERGIDLDSYRWFEDPVELATQSDADVIIEVIGRVRGDSADGLSKYAQGRSAPDYGQ